MRLFLLSVLATGLIGAGLCDAQAVGTISTDRVPDDLNGSNFTYPFPVHVFNFVGQNQALEMAFMDVKPTCKPNGKTAVLLHGKNFCGATWTTTIRVLAGKGYRVIAPDQVGFCKSRKPVDYQFSLRQLAWNTRGLLDSLNVGNVTVIGHSFGGMLTTMFGLQYPETVDELVLVDAVGMEDYTQKGVPYISIDQSRDQEASSTYQSIKSYEQQFYYVGQWDEDYDTWVRMLVNIYYGSQREAYIHCQAKIVDLVLTQPIAQYFDDLKPRTLIIVGNKDRTAIGAQWAPPAVAEKLGRFDLLGPEVSARIPKGDLISFPNEGHAPQISVPVEFHEALLGWLSN
ncbi:alpha/beta hydrolase [Emericellopsis atlantica]|uniref:Alpha/beta hydrolase n=1 Tax=Emericellopsis atlantica TaxID=2614577 RepID=A0A9P7ZE35_9HYPO|nr:alpha/beta hydrolase [Emericellopsis atlantica]KAG9250315.1 alpha/beta hydrolase [Emericellopsis atlantica]